MVKTMTSTRSDQPREVWLSGTENIHMVEELFDDIERQERGSGRSTALAIKYAQIAIHAKGVPVIVRDHHNEEQSHRMVLQLVQLVFDVLNVDYEIGMIGKKIFVKVKPRNPRKF